MDYEKKYKEALKDMRAIYPNLKGDAKLAVEHAFPELAHALKNVNLYTKEQKPVDYDHEMWKNCEANFEGGKKEVIEHPEKYGLTEQKPDTRDADDLQLLGFIYDLLNEIEWKDNWAMSKDECLRRLNNYRPQKPTEWKPQPVSLEALMYAIEGKWDMIKPTSYLSRRLEDLYEGLVNTYNVDEPLIAELPKTAYTAKDIEELKVLKDKIEASMESPVDKPAECEDCAMYLSGNCIHPNGKCENVKSKQEWSEEDKRKLNRIYSIIGWAMDEHAFSSCKKLLGDKEGVELQGFLRSIAKPKPEWGEEDEKKITFLERLIRYNVPEGQYGWADGHKSGFITKSEAISKLKSLRPHWKPSEEQMAALNALNCHGDLSYIGQQNQLISLYNDLKKLM